MPTAADADRPDLFRLFDREHAIKRLAELVAKRSKQQLVTRSSYVVASFFWLHAQYFTKRILAMKSQTNDF